MLPGVARRFRCWPADELAVFGRHGVVDLSSPRGDVAPLVRRALELLPEGDQELDKLVASLIPDAMLPRLEPGHLRAVGTPPAESGHSALLVVSGPGVREALIGVILHASGEAYTVALRAEGAQLPPELAGGEAGLDPRPPDFPETDRPAFVWCSSALATLTRPAAELLDDHRWWGDVGALIMLADLVFTDGEAR
jgi:hypothetical protein